MSSFDNDMPMRRHELLSDVERVVTDTARDLGADADTAELLGVAAADALAEYWAGQQITYPMDCHHHAVARKEREIMALVAAGQKVWQIARRYKMHERSVRKLIKRVEARMAEIDAQPDLFQPPPSPPKSP